MKLTFKDNRSLGRSIYSRTLYSYAIQNISRLKRSRNGAGGHVGGESHAGTCCAHGAKVPAELDPPNPPFAAIQSPKLAKINLFLRYKVHL